MTQRTGLTTAREKLADEHTLNGDSGFAGSGLGGAESPERREERLRERANRRAGVLILVAGCLLMALAAGDASSAEPEPAAERALAQTTAQHHSR